MEYRDDGPATGRRARGRPRGWDDRTAQYTIKSLDRAMEILECLDEAPGKSLTMIASETGRSLATVYRTLVTLEGRGLVEFDHGEQVWHIGLRAFVIGTRFLRRTGLVDRARPIMRKLMEVTGETANLGIERGGEIVFLSQVETHASIRAFFPPGTLSGAPKVRAMEIIDELEPHRRGLYGGAVGYFSADGNMDFAIALRTAVIRKGRMHVQAGAGVVLDSNPEAERQETVNKACALFQAASEAWRFA